MQEFPEGFDLAALLAPIAGEAPAGADLRKEESPDPLYHRIRDARREATAAERAADVPPDEGDPRPAQAAPLISPLSSWRIVRELATEALTVHSKDLEIAAWLTEAMLRDSGLVGVTAGFRLMAGLAQGFWDELFPHPDEEGVVTRVAPVAGLNGAGREGTLIQPLRKLVLFERPSDRSPFYFWQYQRSVEVAGSADAELRQSLFETGRAVPFETVESEAHAVGGVHFALLRGQAAGATAAWQALGQILDERAGADAPPTSQVRDLLEQIRDVAGRFASPEAGAPEGTIISAPELAPAAPGAGPAIPSAGLASREEALRALVQIAEFFRRTEPHSPLAYTLQEAVRRGRMTWPELLAEIVPDPTSRSAILSSLGIRPPPSE